MHRVKKAMKKAKILVVEDEHTVAMLIQDR
jgi:hypothetical protein